MLLFIEGSNPCLFVQSEKRRSGGGASKEKRGYKSLLSEESSSASLTDGVFERQRIRDRLQKDDEKERWS